MGRDARSNSASYMRSPEHEANAYRFVPEPGAVPGRRRTQRSLGWVAVCFITYFNVCGGPWGSEEIFSSVGPLPGLIGILLVMPLTFGIPLGLVTAELSSLFPGNGGYSLWVSEAFGPFWGYQELMWSWMSGVVDNALYPLLTYRAIEFAMFGGPGRVPYFVAWLCRISIAAVYALPGLFLLREVGSGLSFLAIFILLPFVVLSAYGLFALPKRWGVLLEADSGATWDDWSSLISVLYWNFSGFDSMSTCAGEVRDPGRSYTRGLAGCVGLTVLTYIVPLSVAAVVDRPSVDTWTDGSFATIARDQVGVWLMAWIAVAAGVGNFGMFVAEMFEDAWQLNGMACVGVVPRIFSYRHPRFQTPWTCILLQFLIISGLQAFDFSVILCIDNFFSVIATVLEILAFLYLRYAHPQLHRPFRIPLSNTAATLLVLPMLLLGLVVAVVGLLDGWVSFGINIGFLVFSIVSYYAMQRYFRVEYEGLAEHVDSGTEGPADSDDGSPSGGPPGVRMWVGNFTPPTTGVLGTDSGEFTLKSGDCKQSEPTEEELQ